MHALIPHLLILVDMHFSTTNLSALIFNQNRPEMQSQKAGRRGGRNRHRHRQALWRIVPPPLTKILYETLYMYCIGRASIWSWRKKIAFWPPALMVKIYLMIFLSMIIPTVYAKTSLIGTLECYQQSTAIDVHARYSRLGWSMNIIVCTCLVYGYKYTFWDFMQLYLYTSKDLPDGYGTALIYKMECSCHQLIKQLGQFAASM